jgi:iron complex transport system ATP-binding protein
MLEIRQLRLRRRSGFTLDIPLWRVCGGELCAVLGTNGAGKSTLLKLLCGEEAAGNGQVLLHDRPLQHWPALERARHLGVLPQASSLDFNFSAEEVVSLGLTPLSLGWRDARRTVQAVMRATDCAHLAHMEYPRLSGGERQRVHLARVLVQLSQAEQAPVLLLDEPTSAQDLGQQHRMLELARNLAREHGYCIAAILHDLNHALRYADHCLLLDAGQSIASGRPEQVITVECVERYWGYRAHFVKDRLGRALVA